MRNRLSLVAVFAALLPLAAGCARPDTAMQTGTLDRSCLVVLAADAGDDATARSLQEELRAGRMAGTAAERLGYRFVARARISNDPGYYTVAQQAAVCAESINRGDAAARLLRGHVLHQMHRFKEAESVARHLIGERQFVLDYGLLGDALMEQGRLDEAGEAYQKMINLKPFYQSYVRAAHLRWLKGDIDGAAQLAGQALKAASPRDPESVAWAYTRLASYALQQGRLRDARTFSEGALQYVPNYAAALLVQGRIFLADYKAAEATAVLERAARQNPLPEYQWALADALRLAGRTADTVAVEAELVRRGEAADPRTLALFLATRQSDNKTAVRLARRELDTRADLFTLDALAWALFAGGHAAEASAAMTRALHEGTQDGRLFVHAAAIAAAENREADAARWARKARALRFTLLPSELEVLDRVAGQPLARGN